MNLRVSEQSPPRVKVERAKLAEAKLAGADGLRAVELLIQRLVVGEVVDRLAAMALEQLDRGGRRVRARLAIAAGKAFGVRESDGIAWAASVELLHNATLVHDDIQDGDTVRRGRPTIWAKHGVAQAINAGDYLLMLPYLALGEVAPRHQGRLSLMLAETSTRIVRGQVQELGLLEAGRLDAASYYAAARGKTGALFELPVAGAAALADAPESEVSELSALFGKIGFIFQLQDDVVDLFGDKGREEPGSDIREGKVSALIVELVRQRPRLHEQVVAILRKSRAATTAADVEWVAQACRATGALDAVLQSIEQNVQEACEIARHHRNDGIRALVQELIRLSLAPLEDAGLVESHRTRGVR
jgi:geranylgeranyl diphosphate synthase, type I